MQKDKVNMKRRRLNDFPELQVGYPERNDVSNPDIESMDVDLDGPRTRARRGAQVAGEMKGTKISHA